MKGTHTQHALPYTTTQEYVLQRSQRRAELNRCQQTTNEKELRAAISPDKLCKTNFRQFILTDVKKFPLNKPSQDKKTT